MNISSTSFETTPKQTYDRARAQHKKFCASSARARAARWVNLMVIFQWTWTFTISDSYWSFKEVFEENGLHISANKNAREESHDSMERRRSRKVEKDETLSQRRETSKSIWNMWRLEVEWMQEDLKQFMIKFRCSKKESRVREFFLARAGFSARVVGLISGTKSDMGTF